MIAQMLKYSFLVYHEGYTDFLQQIRNLGVAHIIEKQANVPEHIQEKYELVKQIQSVYKSLIKREIDISKTAKVSNGKAFFEEVRSLIDELEQKNQQRNQLTKEINLVKHWGDFSPTLINTLMGHGLHIRFFTISSRKFKPEWLSQYPIEIIGQQGGSSLFILIQQNQEDIDIDAEEVRVPERPISELQVSVEQLEMIIQDLQRQLDHHSATSILAIKQYYLETLETIQYEKALDNTIAEAEKKVMLLQGWVPEEKQDELNAYLETKHVLHLVEKPEKEDKVPILLKNQKFSQRFEMLGELYSLPKYNELDLTPFFAPFYMIFFGFCLGDAGYGLLMVLASIILKKRLKKEMKTVMGLVFYLGLSTILFGIIGGTLFGIPLYDTNLPVYSTLAQHFTKHGTDINQLLFYLALVFGGLQIMFGMFIKAINEIKQFGWGFALGTIGWISLIMGGLTIYIFSHFMGKPLENMNTPLYILLVISGLLILPLNNLRRNVFMNVGIGLWTTYNMITGILGDLLSYIRLFALGISSAIMGFVFNSLAVEMSGSIPVLNIIIMVLILVIGHSINIFMSGLGAFVHPMRLTFVEFYKNAGFSGGGKKYNPFRTIT